LDVIPYAEDGEQTQRIVIMNRVNDLEEAAARIH
jgi:hypothetical protein